MLITPVDISAYTRCPHLYFSKNFDAIMPPMSVTEKTIRQSVIQGEKLTLLKGSVVAPRKLIRVWDRLWWPAAIAAGISMEEAEDISVKSAFKLTDYCKYEFTGYMHPTIGTSVTVEKRIGSSILRAQADVLKVDLSNDTKSTIIIDFSRKNMDIASVSMDPGVRALAYAFYTGKGEEIRYISFSIDDKNKSLSVAHAIFREKDMEDTEKMLYYIETGIRKKISWFNYAACGGCKVCQHFKFLTKENTL